MQHRPKRHDDPPPATLAASRQAQLQCMVRLGHPHLAEVDRVDAAGVHFADDAPRRLLALVHNLDDLATVGYAVGRAVVLAETVDLHLGCIDTAHVGVHADGHVQLRIDPRTTRPAHSRTQPGLLNAGRLDTGRLDTGRLDADRTAWAGLLAALLDHVTALHPVGEPDHPVHAVLERMNTDDTTEILVHRFATARASATLAPAEPARPDPRGSETTADPPAPTLDDPGFSRRFAAAVALAAAIVVTVILDAATSAEDPAPPSAGTPAYVGEPGDVLHMSDVDCDGVDDVVLWRPGTGEGFVFTLGDGSITEQTATEQTATEQTATAEFLARDATAAAAAARRC